MPRKPLDTQERKSERVGLAVTKDEKADILLVAKARAVRDHSILFRDLSLRAIRREAKRLRSVLRAA
jgi:hypothetical protein